MISKRYGIIFDGRSFEISRNDKAECERFIFRISPDDTSAWHSFVRTFKEDGYAEVCLEECVLSARGYCGKVHLETEVCTCECTSTSMYIFSKKEFDNLLEVIEDRSSQLDTKKDSTSRGIFRARNTEYL